jgi:hypothetical protein
MAITTHWTRENLAWVGGLFEGEGSIYPKKNRLSLSSTDRDVVYRFAEIVGVGSIREHAPRAQQLGKKTQWTWTLNRQVHAQAVLAAIWPWLGARRKQKAVELFKKIAVIYAPLAGERNGNAKITAQDAADIFNSDRRPARLSEQYGITITAVMAIKAQKSWKSIHGNHDLR